MITVLIPAHNEEAYIGNCLSSILEQKTNIQKDALKLQVIVAANGCSDKTVDVSRSYIRNFEAVGIRLDVIQISESGKANAINIAESTALYDSRVYVDADIILGETFISEIADLLNDSRPVYASGTLRIAPMKSWITRCYANVWSRLPFVVQGVPGIGVYAVNGAGRRRWGPFPTIIADDRFVRINFQPQERKRTNAKYDWPLPEGLFRLLHVRTRWTEGNLELNRLYPHLTKNDVERNSLFASWPTVMSMPISGSVFALVYIVGVIRARLSAANPPVGWRRGRA